MTPKSSERDSHFDHSSPTYLTLPSAIHKLQGNVPRHLANLLPRLDLLHLRLDKLVHPQLIEGVEVNVECQDDCRHKEGEPEPQQVLPFEDLLGDLLGDAEGEGLGPVHGIFELNKCKQRKLEQNLAGFTDIFKCSKYFDII